MMKRVLLPVSEYEYNSADGRLFNLAKGLSEHFIVKFLTFSKDVVDTINKKASDCKNISAEFVETGSIPLPLDLRTNLVKIFIQFTDDLFIPGTDLKLWKTAATDDFWGHLSPCSYEGKLTVDADIVLLPLLTYDYTPPEDTDVFYTSVLFKAKEADIKVAGYQLYPVFNGHKLMPRLMDALIIRKDYEKQFYIDKGIAAENIYLLTDAKDRYSLSTITDAFQNHLYNDQIPISRDELAVVVFHHAKFRPHIRQIIKAIGNAKVPVALFLVKLGFVIKDLLEDQIVNDFYLEDIKKAGCRFYLVEPQSSVPVEMISDVIIAPAYTAPLELAFRYGKKTIVYNPFYDNMPDVEGTDFINTHQELTAALKRAHHEKKTTVSMADAINSILRTGKR